MKQGILKRIFLVIGIIIGAVFLAGLLVPLFITPDPLQGLSTKEAVKSDESEFITIPFKGTDGIDIHFIEKGDHSADKPVFILLHGSMYNSFSWDNIIDSIASAGRTIAYDQIPYGLSEKLMEGDWTGSNPYTSKAALEQLVSFLDILDIDKACLIGSSYGGTLAIQAAIEFPDRVSGLILVDPAVFVDESMPNWLINSPQMNNMGPYLARFLGKGDSFYKSCYSNPSFFSGERKQKTMILTEIQNWDFALWQYLKAWSSNSVDLESQITAINIPALIISGSEDEIVSPDDCQKLNNLLGNSTLKMIPETGHMPHEESPDQFIEAVLPWITAEYLR